MTTILELVRNFITDRSPAAICDDCITDRLGLSVRQHANQKTRQLAEETGFERRNGVCSICGDEKRVIRGARA